MIPPLSPENCGFLQPKTRYFQTLNQRPVLHRFCARELSPGQAKQPHKQQLLKSVRWSLESLLHQVFCCLHNYKLLFLSLCLAVALSVSLSLSHSPLSLLWGVKKEPTGDRCSIMQVCSCALCCRLFAPHIAFLPVETHTRNNRTYAPGIELWLPLWILCQV